MKIKIGVLGPHACPKDTYQLGFEVGAAIARREAILICGGLDGMMKAAAEGAKSENGLTIGILPGESSLDANPFIDVPLPTGLGPLRNGLIAQVGDAVIAIRGGYGTLSEIAFSLRVGTPVVGLDTWELLQDGRIDPGIHLAKTAKEAVDLAMELAAQRYGNKSTE